MKISLIFLFLISSMTFAQGNDLLTKDAKDFKNLFHTVLEDIGESHKIDPLFHVPSQNLLQDSSANLFNPIESIYQNIQPQYFEDILRKSFTSKALKFDDEGEITIVLVPGIFAEFIKTHAFEEVFRNNQRIEIDSQVTDYQFSIDDLTMKDKDFVENPSFNISELQKSKNKTFMKEVPLNELFLITSINFKKVKINLVLFDAKRFSLETLEDLEVISSIYNRRLEKLMKSNTALNKNLVLMGYSRGSTIALEMLNQENNKKQSTWLKNVKGLISLAGVNYGSDIADLTFCEGDEVKCPHPNNKLIKSIKELTNNLEYVPQTNGSSKIAKLTKQAQTVNRNKNHWLNFIENTKSESVDELESEEKNKELDFEKIKTFIDTKISSTLRIGLEAAFTKIKLANLITKSDQNVLRWKKIINNLITAAEQLSTKERLKWWKTANLPTKNIKYYAIAATISPEEAPFGEDPVSYNTTTADYRILRNGYNDFTSNTGFILNDSQVAVHKAFFWNGVNSQLNPNLKTQQLDTSNLGILNAHHWGVALETANEMNDGSKNPFPREQLLKALSLKVIKDLK